MSKTTIQVTSETKELLNQIRARYEFLTYDQCISSMGYFITRNKVNPQEDFVGNFKTELGILEQNLIRFISDSNKKISKDNATLRSWVGGITNDHLVPLTQKLSVLDKLNISEINKYSSDNSSNSKFENPMNNNLPVQKREQEIVKDNSDELDKLNKKYKELFSKYDTQKQMLFKIINSVKVEQGGMISKEKIIINLPLDEWETIRTSI